MSALLPEQPSCDLHSRRMSTNMSTTIPTPLQKCVNDVSTTCSSVDLSSYHDRVSMAVGASPYVMAAAKRICESFPGMDQTQCIGQQSCYFFKGNQHHTCMNMSACMQQTTPIVSMKK